MSCMQDYRRARDVARHRRVHLSSRALLKLLAHLAGRLESIFRSARAELDPTGGAEAPIR